MNWSRKVGVFLVVAGTLLCATYLVPTVYGSAMSHLAVARFRAQSSSNSLWDSSRIRAYQRTLDLTFSPPEAVLRVPSVGIEVPVLEGVSDLNLNRGVGHIPGTAMPGGDGNTAITGHRDGFFRPLKDVVPGEMIELQLPPTTENAAPRTLRYKILSTSVVFPTDTSVLKPSNGSTLTLITCYPFYFAGPAPQRFIVHAALLASSS
jgi:sortase A